MDAARKSTLDIPAVQEVIRNAKRLITDAGLLLSSGSAGSALSLAILAFEEAGKGYVIELKLEKPKNIHSWHQFRHAVAFQVLSISLAQKYGIDLRVISSKIKDRHSQLKLRPFKDPLPPMSDQLRDELRAELLPQLGKLSAAQLKVYGVESRWLEKIGQAVTTGELEKRRQSGLYVDIDASLTVTSSPMTIDKEEGDAVGVGGDPRGEPPGRRGFLSTLQPVGRVARIAGNRRKELGGHPALVESAVRQKRRSLRARQISRTTPKARAEIPPAGKGTASAAPPLRGVPALGLIERQASDQRQVGRAEGPDLVEILGHTVPPHARPPPCPPGGYGAGMPAVTLHGHFAQLRSHWAVLAMSAATVDRALRDVKERATGKRRRRAPPSAAVRRSAPVRTFSDWKDPAPGFFEADLVAHSGPTSRGS